MSTLLEEKIVNLEKLLNGRVSTEFKSSPVTQSKIEPLATILVCRPPHNLHKEQYLTTKGTVSRSRWADIPNPYYIIIEYFGNQEELSNVMKITVTDIAREESSSHIYSPDLDELIYSDNIIQDYFGKHLLLKRHINLTKAYQELTNIGINIDANNNQITKNSTK